MSTREDEFIGGKLRDIRKRKGLSQKDVAAYLDISYQQVQQYESGSTRMPASVLFRISNFLQVPPSYFFEGLEALLEKKVQTGTINTVRQQPLNILLVEDNMADEELIREVLSPMHATLEVIRDGDGFNQRISKMSEVGESARTEIILLDITVGKEDGINWLSSLKRNRNVCDIPVIILTNSIQSEDVIRAYKAGASGFIKKSPTITDMRERMQEVVDYWSHVTLPSMQFVAA